LLHVTHGGIERPAAFRHDVLSLPTEFPNTTRALAVTRRDGVGEVVTRRDDRWRFA
jgi:hypothetical protein